MVFRIFERIQLTMTEKFQYLRKWTHKSLIFIKGQTNTYPQGATQMKKFTFIIVILAAATTIFAQPMMGQVPVKPGPGMLAGGSYLSTEMKAVAEELGGKPFGSLTLDELTPLKARLALASRKDGWVAKTAMMSMHLSGMGQFRTGDTLGGLGFLTLHGGVVAGALVGAYWLLPADLRFDKIDYLNASRTTIEANLKSHSFMDFLPAMAVMGAGMLVDGGVRAWSAHSAATEARTSIDSGKVKFETLAGPGFLGMSMRY